MEEFIQNFIAWYITLCILILPVFGVVKLIKGITKKIKRKPPIHTVNTEKPVAEEWKSEWKWNEETQLWEHPLSKRNSGSYNYSQSELHEINTQGSDRVDVSNKRTEESKAEGHHSEIIDIIIPDNIQALIDEARKEKEEIQKKRKEKVDKKQDIQKAEKPKESFRRNTGPRLIYTYAKPELKEKDKAEINAELDFHTAYQRREIFTRNEWQNYKKLRDVAEAKGLVVCPKVRLFDIIEPRLDKKRKLTYRYKIQAKHVDFVVCDHDMHIVAIIELDDNSHYDPDRIKRDNFVNMILTSVGYTVIHTKQINYDILDVI